MRVNDNVSHSARQRCALATVAWFITAAFAAGQPVQAQPPAAPGDAKPKLKVIEIPFTSHDGYEMFGKLTLPESGGLHAVVINIQTAEGATVDIRRRNPRGGIMNVNDVYREQLAGIDVGFFSYEGRGIRQGDDPPLFERIDRAVYNTSTLENKVRDAITAVGIVQKQAGVDGSQIFLIGASEGTLLAAETATRIPKEIKGLILHAVLSTTLKDMMKYMFIDGAFLPHARYFDTNKDGKISPEEYDADQMGVRRAAMKDVRFESFDANKDGYYTMEDRRLFGKPILEGIETQNYEMLNTLLKTTSGVSLPDGWVKDHFAHASMWSFLSQLDMPIGFFHGDADNLTPIEGVKALEAQAKQAGKRNMEFHYFEGLDHNLGVIDYFRRGTLSEAYKSTFQYVKTHVEKK